MLSVILRVQLKYPLGGSLKSFEGRWKARVEHPILDEILAGTAIAGIDNATVSQHLALNDGTFDTYPKIMEALETFLRARREWNVSSEDDPIVVK